MSNTPPGPEPNAVRETVPYGVPETVSEGGASAGEALISLSRLGPSVALLIVLILTVVAWPQPSLLVCAGLLAIAGIAAAIDWWNRCRADQAGDARMAITAPTQCLPDHRDHRHGSGTGGAPCR